MPASTNDVFPASRNVKKEKERGSLSEKEQVNQGVKFRLVANAALTAAFSALQESVQVEREILRLAAVNEFGKDNVLVKMLRTTNRMVSAIASDIV